MITKIQLGEKSKDVLLLEFGKGDIMFNGVSFPEHTYGLAFQEHEPRPIGSTTDEYNGKTTDELPNETKLIMSFTRVESITAVIHSLLEVQQRMFDEQKLV